MAPSTAPDNSLCRISSPPAESGSHRSRCRTIGSPRHPGQAASRGAGRDPRDCRGMPSIAASRGRALQSETGRTMTGPPTPGSSPPAERPPDDRLDSWKEIAAYLRRDVTTVQRWEKREGMPVHRHLHQKMGSVYAFKTDLDAWARSRGSLSSPSPTSSRSPSARRSRLRPPQRGVGGGASGSLPRPARSSSPLRDGSSRKPGPRRRTRWRTRGFCRSPTSTASSRPPRFRATEGSWPSCPIATGRWTCGSPRSAWVSSTT